MRGLTLLGAVILSLAAVGAKSDAPPNAGNQAAAMPVVPTIVTSQPIADGMVYADLKGKTLYTFDRDTQPGKSACTDACLKDWTPLPAPWITHPAGDWAVISRDDGIKQLAYKNKPLYTYGGDHKSGDVSGDGADNLWHAVVTARKYTPPEVAIRTLPFNKLGQAFTTADGKTLYLVVQYHFNAGGTRRHSNQNPGTAACTGDCTQTWVPFKAPDNAKVDGDWTVMTREDGTKQWAWKGWPLYTNANDSKPGDTMGEGVHKMSDGITGLYWEVATLST